MHHCSKDTTDGEVFWLPETSGPVERVFSFMNNVCSDEKCSMSESIVINLLVIS